MSEDFLGVRHYALWTAIDDLAVQVNLWLSALAKHAGLDACTLNLPSELAAASFNGRAEQPYAVHRPLPDDQLLIVAAPG